MNTNSMQNQQMIKRLKNNIREENKIDFLPLYYIPYEEFKLCLSSYPINIKLF